MNILSTLLQLFGLLLLVAAGFVASPVWGLATAGCVAVLVGYLLEEDKSDA